MTIGFVVHFFDFRNDVRKVINIISQYHKVVLFVRREDTEHIKRFLRENIEIRIVDEKLKNVRNIVLDNLFRFFGKLPKSVQNYYLMELFKISSSPQYVQRRAKLLLNISMKMPKYVSYDYYLNRLTYKGATFIDDIDQFICFTDISDTYLLARLIREKKKINVYVYSWDHPCKQFKYSKQVNYLVWNEGIKQDMIELQHIEARQIKITGASQFAYVEQFLSIPRHKLKHTFSFPYIYFGCAIGTPELVREEIKVIEIISKLMLEQMPDVRLVVRPYPVMKNWEVYQDLKPLANVLLDDQFRSKDMSINEELIMDKFVKIHFALAFIHLGTTLGFEACFTQTPSIIIDFDYFQKSTALLSIRDFVHQYQNKKYLLLNEYPNVVHSEKELRSVLSSLESSQQKYLPYNLVIRKTTPLRSFEEFARNLIDS